MAKATKHQQASLAEKWRIGGANGENRRQPAAQRQRLYGSKRNRAKSNGVSKP